MAAPNPTINAYAAQSLAHAKQMAAAVDAALGYPNAATATRTYDDPMIHPSGAQWAYVADSVTTPILQPQAVALSLPAAAVLDATWFQAVATPPAAPLFSRRTLAVAGVALAMGGIVAAAALGTGPAANQVSPDAATLDAGDES